MTAHPEIDESQLPERLEALPGIELIRRATAGLPAYLVGGAVRDLLLGLERADIDISVESEVRPLAEALGGQVVEHARFEPGGVGVNAHETTPAQPGAGE